MWRGEVLPAPWPDRGSLTPLVSHAPLVVILCFPDRPLAMPVLAPQVLLQLLRPVQVLHALGPDALLGLVAVSLICRERRCHRSPEPGAARAPGRTHI